MTTDTVERLRGKQEELKARQRELADQFHSAHGGSPDAAKARDKVRLDLQALAEEQRLLGPKIQEAKEQRKRDRLAQMLATPEYRAAVASALAGLEATLGPWSRLLEMTVGGQRGAVAAPALPTAIAGLVVESREWIKRLIRLGAIKESDLPPALCSLLEVK